MDAEDIKTQIVSLGRKPFKALVALFLRKFYHLTAIDIDGAGDKGNDWFTFTESGGKYYIFQFKTLFKISGGTRKQLMTPKPRSPNSMQTGIFSSPNVYTLRRV